MPGQALRDFDIKALCATLDAARRARNLTWEQLTAEINVPFKGTPSIPISVGTLRGMQSKSSVTSAVVLQVLRWLGRSPESFLARRDGLATAHEALADPGPARILRFDTRALYAALDTRRAERGLTWKEVASELRGFSPNMLRNLEAGPLIGFPRVMLLTQWLGQPAADYVRACAR